MDNGTVIITVDREAWLTLDTAGMRGGQLTAEQLKDLEQARALMTQLGYARLGRTEVDDEGIEFELIP